MGRILGLDLGTNSVGWAIVDVNNTNEYALRHQGVRIFQEGVKIEKGIESSKASERTKHRSARRLYFRRRLRKIRTLEMLIKYDMCPLPPEQLELWRKNKSKYPVSKEFREWLRTIEPNDDNHEGYNPYLLRAKAVKEKLSLYDIGRALYHLAQRRGFKSNRLDQNNDDDSIVEQYIPEIQNIIEDSSSITELSIGLETFCSSIETEDKKLKALINKLNRFNKYLISRQDLSIVEEKEKLTNILNKKENLGAVKGGIKELSEEIEESGYEYLGEYFYHILYKNNIQIRNKYTSREEHYEKEFNKICKIQEFTDKQKEDFWKAIFYQRPLKSQKGLVGKCVFEKDKPRCPISHPLFEKYRMLCFLNSIKIKTPSDDRLRPLSGDERAKCIPLFYRKSKPNFDFDEIRKKLAPSGVTCAYSKSRESSTAEYIFNFHFKTSVSGCPTSANLKSVFGGDWEYELFRLYSNKALKNREKTVDEVVHDVWHVLFSFDSKDKLEEWCIKRLKRTNEIALKFSKIIIKQDYASLSLKAIKKILPYLEIGYLYSHSVFLANLPSVVGELWNDNEIKNNIEKSINDILDNQVEQNIAIDIVNGLIKDYRENNVDIVMLPKLVAQYKEDLHVQLEKRYGKDVWGSFSDEQKKYYKDFILESFEEYALKNMGKGTFYKKLRTDERIIKYLREVHNIDQNKLQEIFHPSDIDVYKKAIRASDEKFYLGSPRTDSIKNPVAMRSLYQVKLVVNELIKQDYIDEKTKIHIELAKELNDANMRIAIKRWQKNNENQNMKYCEEIKKIYEAECNEVIEPSKDDILKYKLWEEQHHICLYTGASVGIFDFLGNNPKYDIEHTIPRSLSCDNSQENLTLCEKRYNRDIKRNKIPSELSEYQTIMQRLEPWRKDIENIDKLIYSAKRQIKGASTKEMKDKAIQKKNQLILEKNYWQNKYKRFEMQEVPDGFKNSQLVDTRIITKYARMYLQTVFNKVYTVQGKVVSDFRKTWGIQNEYEKKSRINHIHHCIDAVTIACITLDNYNALAHYYYHLEQMENKKGEYKPDNFSKPWETFTQDVKALEHNVLVTHDTPDKLLIQSKKKLRRRGKIQYNDEGKIKYQIGNTVRGSLHKDTYYGCIKSLNNKTGEYELKYVIRKSLKELKESDIKNIVDKGVKEKIKSVIDKKGFKKTMSEIIWMNQKKGIPINKVRLKANVTSPISLKKHRDISEYQHKQNVYVVNDGNYVMGIYEIKSRGGKLLRDFQVVSNLDAIKNKESLDFFGFPLVKKRNKYELPLKYYIKKGLMILLYEKEKDEIWELNQQEKCKRLFEIIKFDARPRIICRYHQEARVAKEINEEFNVNYDSIQSQVSLSLNNFNALIEGCDFKIDVLGNIIKLNYD